MDLFENPFYILGATPRDNRQRIVELAEERSLVLNPEICNKARADLLHPRKRIAAEVTWLPGVGPNKANKLVESIHNSTDDVLEYKDLPVIAKTNLLASTLIRLKEFDSDDCRDIMSLLILSYEDIVASDTFKLINEDRIISSFPILNDILIVEEELYRIRTFYHDTCNKILDQLESSRLINTLIYLVKNLTFTGNYHPPELLEGIIDNYEVSIQELIKKQKSVIDDIIYKLKISYNSKQDNENIKVLVNDLRKEVSIWAFFLKPLQISKSSIGLEFNQGHSVYIDIRNLSVEISNKYYDYKISKELFDILSTNELYYDRLEEEIQQDKIILTELLNENEKETIMNELRKLCDVSIKKAEIKPAKANLEAQRIINNARRSFIKLREIDLPDNELNNIRDYVSLCVSQCAIIFCNETNNHKMAIKILNDAKRLAKLDETINYIRNNLNTIEEMNHLTNDVEPIKSTPWLGTMNGVGFTIYGKDEDDSTTGSYVATYYFVFLWLPILPIARYKVFPKGGGYRFMGKRPLRVFDWIHIMVAVALLVWFIFHMAILMSS